MLLKRINILFTWRYWPMELLYLPLTLYVLFVGSFRAGKLFYFAAANPKIPLGGFANDSKYFITQHIPDAYKPYTVLITKKDNILELLQKIKNIDFPLIAKPDIGEGGFQVKKINNENELINYHTHHAIDYLVQEFIDYPVELSLLIHDAEGSIKISSITERIHLAVIGDGLSTIEQLLLKHEQAKFRMNKIRKHIDNALNYVPENGEVIRPVSVGNWDFGALYIDRTDIQTPALLTAISTINENINLFSYARYDIKCKSVNDFLNGEMKILEINGVKGEPIHIYDKKYSLNDAYKEIFKHWGYILTISKRNIKNGVKCPNATQGFSHLWKHIRIKKLSLQKRIVYE